VTNRGTYGAGERIIHIGLAATLVLMVLKIVAGLLGKSEAVVADGIESACDVVALASAMIGFRLATKPQDEKHPYGHGRAESISAIVVSFVIFVTGAGILVQAAKALLSGEYDRPQGIAVAAAVVTIGAKAWLYRYTKRAAVSLRSPSLGALAQDHRKDALTSVATLVGVSGGYLGAGFMDPLAAAITSIFIFRIGFTTFRGAAHDLMDGVAASEEVEAIVSLVEGVDGVEHVHEIRARCSGRFLIVDLKLDMDPEMTVKRSHGIATEVKRLIFARFSNVGDVMIHINPHDEDHTDLTRL
jgi:cation diffusion facilitator family transporter